MSFDVAVRVRDVSKHYLMFERPEDRLKQMLAPRLQRLIGREPHRYYRDFTALSGVSFEVRRGETIGIIGRNGCGKSTLLQIVCGTLQPSSGSIEVNGRIAALLELGAGFNPEFTGRENVFLNAAILGLSTAETEARFDDIARFADIGAFIEHPVKTYSSGMYVRLAFATAINVDPDILVVDEALAVGDEAFQRKCFARIEDIKEKGGTILFVSHGAQTIVQLCDRAMLLDRGELILEGRPKGVVSHYQRLANASADAADGVRASIVTLRDTPASTWSAVPHAAPEGDLAHGRSPADAQIDDLLEAGQVETVAESDASPADYFDPSLKSDSALYFEERGARIRDVRIVTLDGKPVNVLRTGKRYVFEYAVDFGIDATDVGFSMGLKSIAGVKLAGLMTRDSRGHALGHVARGASICARFEFSCSLNAGTYAIGCGVAGIVNGDAYHLHRVVDALLMRVASESDLLQNGMVDLSFVPTVAIGTAVPGSVRFDLGADA